MGYGCGKELIVHGRGEGQVLAPGHVSPLRDVCDGELQVRFHRSRLVNQMLHALENLDGMAHAPSEVVEAELNQEEVRLIGSDLLGDEVLGLAGLPSAGGEMVRVGQ